MVGAGAAAQEPLVLRRDRGRARRRSSRARRRCRRRPAPRCPSARDAATAAARRTRRPPSRTLPGIGDGGDALRGSERAQLRRRGRDGRRRARASCRGRGSAWRHRRARKAAASIAPAPSRSVLNPIRMRRCTMPIGTSSSALQRAAKRGNIASKTDRDGDRRHATQRPWWALAHLLGGVDMARTISGGTSRSLRNCVTQADCGIRERRGDEDAIRGRDGRRCRRAGGCLAGRGWEPTKPVEFIVPGRHRRRRRPDGAPAAGRHHEEQPDEAADDRRQQVRRRRRRRLPRGQGREGRSQQDHHHAVEPVHDAARDRRAVQLEGPDAGRDAGARPVRAVGQRRDAVQDGEGLSRRGQGRRPQQVQDGRHGVEAGRPDHHGRDREGHRHQVHLRAVQGRRRRRRAARRQAHRLDASTTRSRRSRNGAPARCGRCACSTTTPMPYKAKVTDTMSWNDIPTLQGRRASPSTT